MKTKQIKNKKQQQRHNMWCFASDRSEHKYICCLFQSVLGFFLQTSSAFYFSIKMFVDGYKHIQRYTYTHKHFSRE